MNRYAVLITVFIAAHLSASCTPWAAETAAPTNAPIDWNHARVLYQRSQKGAPLSDDERAYLDRAKQERQKQQTAAPGRTAPLAAPAPRDSLGLRPLSEMTTDDRYQGEDGGLYGHGHNQPPEAHAQAAQTELARIVPLDAEGQPAPHGRIVLASIGMSNTTQEFSRFKELADRDAEKAASVIVVDGAQGGRDAADWDEQTNPDWRTVWRELDRRLTAAGVTSQQVQAVWIKQALKGPGRLGQFPAHARALQSHLEAILHTAKARFPNLRIAYLSSRIYAGYAATPLNPEPYAYEGAFAVRWVIEDQVQGQQTLNWDPARGAVQAPLVLWGPYLWADGVTPRKDDNLSYERSDLGGDGTHPSESGRQKVAEQLLHFFKTDPHAGGWFVGPSGARRN